MKAIKILCHLVFAAMAVSLCACNKGKATIGVSSVAANGTEINPLCPAGYILVSGNAAFGTSQFCVMKFEAKSNAGVATSRASGIPWVSVDQNSSKVACTSLGDGYDLVSNSEWMTIAYDVEAIGSNWSSGSVGTGTLYRGHSDSLPLTALAVIDLNDAYSGTGNTSAQAVGAGKEQRRTLTLSNHEVIWDFAGNVWEWNDWTMSGPLTLGPDSCNAGWTEFFDVSCGALMAADYLPENPSVIPDSSYNSSLGLGRFYGGTGGASLRGGSWLNGYSAGIFALYLNEIPSAAYTGVGFRCVFRP